MPSEPVRSSLVTLKRTIMARVLERRGFEVSQARLQEIDYDTPLTSFFNEFVREARARNTAEQVVTHRQPPELAPEPAPAKSLPNRRAQSGKQEGQRKTEVSSRPGPEARPIGESGRYADPFRQVISPAPSTKALLLSPPFIIWVLAFSSPSLFVLQELPLVVTLAAAILTWGIVGAAQDALMRRSIKGLPTLLPASTRLWSVAAWMAAAAGFLCIYHVLAWMPQSIAFTQNPVRLALAQLIPGFSLGVLSASLYVRQSHDAAIHPLRTPFYGLLWAAAFVSAAYGASVSLNLAGHVPSLRESLSIVQIVAWIAWALFTGAICLASLGAFRNRAR